MTLYELIQIKGIQDAEIKYKLLDIASSSMWVEDLIDLVIELTDKECNGKLDCESCQLVHEEPCDYVNLSNKCASLESQLEHCDGNWNCAECEHDQYEGEECQYHLLKEKYKKLKGDVDEAILKMRGRNGRTVNAEFSRYAAAKENISPVKILEDEMDLVIEGKVDKMKKKLKTTVIVGGIEVPR